MSDVEGIASPSPRSLPTEPEAVMCVAAHISIQEEPPFEIRKGMTTIRPQVVDRLGAASLYCDCLHDGFHEWPPVYQPIRIREDGSVDDSLESDGVDERQVPV